MNFDAPFLQREGLELDYKQRISNPQKIAKTLCAFANTQGGILYIGVNDQRKIVGIDPEEEKYQLEKAAREFCQPPVPYQLEELEIDDSPLALLKIEVPASATRPHACRVKQNWVVYVRYRDQSIPADSQLVKSLNQPSPEAEPYPLEANEERILRFIASRPKTRLEDICRHLNYGKRRVQRMLNTLIQKGLIREFNHEAQAFYSL